MLYVCLLLSELGIVDCVQFSAYIVRFCLQQNERNGVLFWHSVQRLDTSEGGKDNRLIHAILIFIYWFILCFS